MSEMLKLNTALTSLDLRGEREEIIRETTMKGNDDLMTANGIWEEAKKAVRNSWGSRGGELDL